MKDIKQILIVDDDKEDSEFFSMVVNEIGSQIKVAIAESRKELFSALEAAVPDLLFIDSFIQHESGVESISEIRKDVQFKELPIIMYTGASSMENIRKAFQCGASSYVVKPHSIEEIRKVLKQLLNKNWHQHGDRPKQYYLTNRFLDFIEEQ